jgi:hypothetical protein
VTPYFPSSGTGQTNVIFPVSEDLMPIPAPNLYPPFNIVRLSHVELG